MTPAACFDSGAEAAAVIGGFAFVGGMWALWLWRVVREYWR